METNIVQMIPLPEGYSIAIKGLIPDKDNPNKGTILLMGNPMRCVRKEHYSIEGDKVVTDSWNFHVSMLAKFLSHSGSVSEDGTQLIIQEVLPKNYNNGKE
ncbi:MAG: hypothetical protein ACRDD8_14145 [Bacteroidales bacterium]